MFQFGKLFKWLPSSWVWLVQKSKANNFCTHTNAVDLTIEFCCECNVTEYNGHWSSCHDFVFQAALVANISTSHVNVHSSTGLIRLEAYLVEKMMEHQLSILTGFYISKWKSGESGWVRAAERQTGWLLVVLFQWKADFQLNVFPFTK